MKLDGSLKKLGFRKCITEPAVYTRGVGLSSVILGVYVDDLIVTGGDPTEIVDFKKQMTSEFEMSDLGMLSFYLGLEVEQQKDSLLSNRQVMLRRYLLAHIGSPVQVSRPLTSLADHD